MSNENPPEWVPYRSRLVSAYFNEKGIANVASPLHEEFKVFMNKFQSKMPKDFLKKIEGNEKLKEDNTVDLLEPHYDPILKVQFPIPNIEVDEFMTRNIPHTAVAQFDCIVKLFTAFVNKREFKKIDQIRQTQASLPIAASKEEILETVKNNQIMILAGDTGCGKSTQLPQYLLHAGYNKIACTQPRRIACTALAKRVAVEMLNPFGSDVAFQTRFEKTKTLKTRLLFLTDGLLIRQMGMDPLLSQYDVIILDEVHERHLSGDLLVALMKLCCQRRNELKLILMSATINIDLFTSYFEGAPVVQVPGRLYPIEVQYFPVKEYDVGADQKKAKLDTGPYLKIVQMIDKKYPSTERGDMLVFLNGISEMSILADALKEYADYTKRWIVLMLHSTLSVEEQNKVFDAAPNGVRKCILSTNIAETSVTIDEIRFVVDSGKVNLIRYDASTRAQRLVECWISKASAEQRKGRAGRTGPGVCYRLFSQDQLEKMEDFTVSEIRRVSLESLIMQILGMDLKVDVRDFAFIESPGKEPLNAALENLKFQGVVEPHDAKSLTPLGLILSDLPVDVLVGKMLLYGVVLDQVDVTLTIAAGLSVQSAFTNRSFRDFDCIQTRQHLMSDLGDPFSLIKVYREWINLRQRREDTRKWARKCGIEESRLYEIVKLRRQFKQILEQADLLSSRMDKDLEDLSVRERRIKIGEKRKLINLKKKAFNENRKRKVLKEGKHFDTIMDEALETTDVQDDINSLEFHVLVDDAETKEQLISHRLNEEKAVLLKLIIAIGLYPQLGMEDPHNTHRDGKEQFVHVATKPFSILHPNSALGQSPEVLDIQRDSDGNSTGHQLIYFGLLLETTKPFLCNTSRIPALFLLIFARNITYTSEQSVSCDGFVEFIFRKPPYLEGVLEKAMELRSLLLNTVNGKLSGADVKQSTTKIKVLLLDFSHMEYDFSTRRFVHPPRAVESGVFDLSGMPVERFADVMNMERPELDAEDGEEMDEKIKRPEESEEVLAEQRKGKKEFYCEKCEKTLYFTGNFEILKHKRSHAE